MNQQNRIRRYGAFLLCLAGAIAIWLFLPLFETPMPRELSISLSDARAIADAHARTMGIPVDASWPLVTWENNPLLEDELGKSSDLRRAADGDPVISPRLAGYRVTYFRLGMEKRPEHGYVVVDRHGVVVSSRRFARPEEKAESATPAELRRRADEFISSRVLPGVSGATFDSMRPNVLRGRTDHQFRYKVPSAMLGDRIAFFVSVYFIGDQFAGWQLIEEYRDGGAFRFDVTEQLAGTFIQLVITYLLLIVVLVIFLKKYHAGEVGVGTGGLLFAILCVVFIALDYLTIAEATAGTQFGGADARMTAIAQGAFKFLFFDVPLAVLAFLAWAVGESFARERWGTKLATFDAIVHRDLINATVGRSLFRGVLLAPAVSGATLAIAAIPVSFGIARPMIGTGSLFAISSGGGAASTILQAIVVAAVTSVVGFLFVLGFARSRRILPLGFILAVIVGTMIGGSEPPIQPVFWTYLFGFGGVAMAAIAFLAFDLLVAATAVAGGVLLTSLLPVVNSVEGAAQTAPMLGLVIPPVVLLAVAIAGIVRGREIVYEYEDVAPHVKRIIERERVKAEIDAANRIQSALLPSDSPRVGGVTVASHYRAASEIGGDYFDFLYLPDGTIGVAFGDVAGHGLTSGIVMAMTKSALLVQVDYDASPSRVLEVLNGIVMKTAPRRMLMTFFFGILDPDSMTLRFSSAGHLDPYVYRARTGAIEPLSSWGFPLGCRRREAFPEHDVEFGPGDRLILYSDGFIEALDDDGEPFGFDRFERTIVQVASGSAEEIKKALLQSVKRFTSNRPPEDDQTLVVITFDDVAVNEMTA